MNIKDLSINPFDIFDNHWALLASGNKDGFNEMTISWGGMGTFWNKPVVTVYVRPSRYTFKFMEDNDIFTISFFDKAYRNDLAVLGTKSGRDGDKLAKTKIKTKFIDDNTIGFNEAKLTLVCRKIFSQFLDVKDPALLKEFYGDNSIHKMYIGEVIKIIEQ